MRRILTAMIVALSLGATVAPSLVSAEPMQNLAPADRYFGRMKMSILGIRNSIKDLEVRLDRAPEDADHVFDKAVLVEDALHDWQTKFPRDPWIPRYAYKLAKLYGKVARDDARERMNDTLDWLEATYPESEFAFLPRETDLPGE
jgi:hypothetical protein